mmetsp:Transcript_31078/g.78224  ORF Transcript_31078/g.78224 Transcript_31078/m.78224 type:complete len:277 (+) Transcript_31078:58-888(+)
MGAGASRNGDKQIQRLSEAEKESIVVIPKADQDTCVDTMVRCFCGYGTAPEFALDFIFWPLKDGEIFQPLPQNSDGSFAQNPDHEACFRWIFKYCLKEINHTGLTFGIKKEDGKGYAALALVRPPGHKETMTSSIRAAMGVGTTPLWEEKKGAGNEKFVQTKIRQDEIQKAMTKCHKECCPEKHWYVYMLHVDPAYQGKKYGKRLLNMILGLADRDGVPTYLECVGDRNIAIYEKFGFKVIKKYPVLVGMEDKIGGPPLTEGGGLTGMKRHPVKQT